VLRDPLDELDGHSLQGARPLRELARHALQHGDGRRVYVYGPLHGQLRDDDVAVANDRLHQRYDVITGEWVAISPARNTRPQTDASCPLCPGGAELPFRYDAAVFENRFPSFVADAPEPPAGDLTAAAQGRCEVVLYTDQHVASLATLSPAQVARIVAIWQDRCAELFADVRTRVVLAFENRGEEVGATLPHPHGQIYAFDRTPPLIARRVTVLRAHRDRTRRCLHCEAVAQDDAAPERTVFANDTFSVAVPFAAHWPYEIAVRARRHGLRRLTDLAAHELLDLAAALQGVVTRYDALFGFELPFMMVVQQAPADPGHAAVADWHLSVEFLPPHRTPSKLKVRASVETATGLFINDTLPETSAGALAALPAPTSDWSRVPVPVVRHTPPEGNAQT
jgi:UDPglucose--hexose-1-phosphate uridylyltransferase